MNNLTLPKVAKLGCMNVPLVKWVYCIYCICSIFDHIQWIKVVPRQISACLILLAINKFHNHTFIFVHLFQRVKLSENMCVGLWMMLYVLCLSNFTNLIQLNKKRNKGTDSHHVHRFPFWREHCTTSKYKWDSKNKMHTSLYVLFHSHRRAKMTVFHTYHRPLFLIFACVLFQTSVMWQNWISPLFCRT